MEYLMVSGQSRQRRFWQATSIFMLIMSLAVISVPSNVWAFQDGEGEATTSETPPTEPSATETTDDGDSTKNDDAAEEETFLMWMINASGAFGFILLLISFIMVAVIMMNLLQVRRDVLLPEGFVAAFEEKMASKDYQGAYEISRNDDSLIAKVLSAGLGRLNRGYDQAVEGMQEVGEEESMTMEHRLSYLALIGSVAPMIGLMGTVWGMIASFRTISTSPTAPKPKDLADGISTALFTTLEGLVVAIPALVAYGLLRNRVARLLLEAGRVSEGLMSRFSTVGGQKAE